MLPNLIHALNVAIQGSYNRKHFYSTIEEVKQYCFENGLSFVDPRDSNLTKETRTMCRKTDYPEFAKKPITLMCVNIDKMDALVVDCSYHVGITIVAANDHSRQLVCLNRAEFGTIIRDTPDGKQEVLRRLPNWKRAYSILFYSLVAQIKTGHVESVNQLYCDIIKDVCKFHSTNSGSAASCAWS